MSEDDVVMQEVMAEAEAMPNPEFDNKAVPAAHRRALMAYHAQAKTNMAMIAVALRAGFKEALKETHEQLRQVESSLSTDILGVSAQVNVLQAQVRAQAAQMTQMAPSSSSSSAVSDVEARWGHVEMRVIRYLVAWMLRVGAMTNVGVPSVSEFFWHPAQGAGNEENHLTVIYKSNVRLLHMFRDRFTPALPQDFLAQLEKMVHAVFHTVSLKDRVWAKHVREMLGQSAYKASGNAVWVMRTSRLVELMKIELAFMRRGESVLDLGDFEVPITLDFDKKTGQIKFEDVVKGDDGKPVINKAMLKALSAIVPMTPASMYEHAVASTRPVAGKNVEPTTVNELMAYTATRRYWGVIASKEYLESSAFQAGVRMIQRAIRPEEAKVEPEGQVTHIGVDWTNADEVVEPFMTLICSELQIMPQEFRALFVPSAEPVTPKKRKRSSKDEKAKTKSKSKKSKKKADVSDEQPHKDEDEAPKEVQKVVPPTEEDGDATDTDLDKDSLFGEQREPAIEEMIMFRM